MFGVPNLPVTFLFVNYRFAYTIDGVAKSVWLGANPYKMLIISY